MKAESVITIALVSISAFVLHTLIQNRISLPPNITSPRASTYLSVVKSVLSVLIFLTASYVVFMSLRINLTPLFASAGVFGIIIGLGVRSFIEDFFTGFLILTEDTIRVGDYVEIAGSEGVVESLGLRTVRIRDKNGALFIFPNREIKKIVNYSRRQARVIIDIPIKTNQPVEPAIKALEKAIRDLHAHKLVGKFIQNPSRVEGIESIEAGRILIRVLIITRPSERWHAARAYRRIALAILSKEGIQLT